MPGASWASKAQQYNEENVFYSGKNVIGYGHDSKAWTKFTKPKGHKMNEDWRTTGRTSGQMMTDTKEYFERGVEGHNHDLEVQSLGEISVI